MELTENNLLTIQNAHDRLSSSSGCLAWVYDRSHASRKPIGLFLVFYVLAFILGVLLLYNTSSLEWLVLFGVVAGFVTFLAPLLQLNTTGELNWKGEPKGFLQRNSNAVRLFMILEASVDIVLAVYLIDDNTTENLVFELAVGAVICASSALAVLFFGAISNVREWKLDEERLEQKRQLVPLAIVLNDTADVLLISRVVATGQVEAKDVLLYIFLLLNVLISEFSTIFATIAEEKATNTSKSGQESATGLRQAMRNKATAQTVLTGMFIIPSILWLGPLRNQIALWEGTLLFSFPLLVFLWIIYLFISKSRRFFEWSLRGIQTRELIPRTFVGFALTLLAVVDWVENLPFGLQRIVVGSYAMYLLLPIVLRVLGDFVRVDALKRDLRNSTSRSDRYFKTRLTEHELSNFLCEDVIKSTVEVTEIRLERCDVTMYAATAIGEALCSDNAANIHTLRYVWLMNMKSKL